MSKLDPRFRDTVVAPWPSGGGTDIETDRPRGKIAAIAVALVVVVGLAAIPAIGAAIVPRGVASPLFHDEAPTAGIDHVYDGDFEFYVGGGVAVFDCDDDGSPDLYFAGGTNQAALYRNQSPVGGALRFAREADAVTDLARCHGRLSARHRRRRSRWTWPFCGWGENVLLRGRGDCRFERANEAWGFDGGDVWTTAFSATWEDGATLPTLAFGNYLDETSKDPSDRCFDNELVRPDAAGTGFAEPTR